jgi:hypothetical protein
MTIIKTLDGDLYEIPEEILAPFRVPREVVERNQGRVRAGVLADPCEDLARIAGDGAGREPGSEDDSGGQRSPPPQSPS